MQRVRVLAISPALDITMDLETLQQGATNRSTRTLISPGGKGINVSRVLSQGGYQVQLVAPLGGAIGELIEHSLASYSLELKPVHTLANSRLSVALVEKVVTSVNQLAVEIDNDALERLLIELASNSEITVVSGSVPQGFEVGFRRVLETVRKSSKLLVVDTSGPALLSAAASGADFLKPNSHEIAEATGETDIRLASRVLIEAGAKAVLCSLGERGAVLIRSGSALAAKGPEVVGNPTGAGDAMVAALVAALSEGCSDEELLRKAVAAGGLAVTESTAGKIDWGLLVSSEASIEVRELEA